MNSNICEICNLSEFSVGFHYGVVTCEACKKFFLRSEKNDAYLNYKCNQLEQCYIVVTSRASCQYCRYKKCKQLGMDLKFNIKNIENISTVNQTCKVCSQKASGLHFGVNTCEGCKAFFLRSLKNEKYKEYKCKSNNDCQINGCKFCRFDKCAQVGMSHDCCKIGRRSNITKFNSQKRNNSETEDVVGLKLPIKPKRMKPNDTLIESSNSNSNSNDSTATNDCETFLLPRFNFQPFINSNHEYQYFNHYNNDASLIQQNNAQMLTPAFKINSNFQFPLFNHDPTQISWNLTSENFFNSSLTNLVARFNE